MFADHAYFIRGHDVGNYRVILNGIHQTKIHDVPDDRRSMFKASFHPWRETKQNIVFIPAPKNIEHFYGDRWNERALGEIAQATKRHVIVKAKTDGNLRDFLKQAHCVVSHSSVAAVEAACFGVPVFGPESSPAYLIGESDLSRIESPVFPDREKWLNTLTYSQFTKQEITSGFAWATVKELNGV